MLYNLEQLCGRGQQGEKLFVREFETPGPPDLALASDNRTARQVMIPLMIPLPRGRRRALEKERIMSRRSRRNHASAFKAKVAIAAVKGDQTVAELAKQFDIHPNCVTQWKTQLLERAGKIFDGAKPVSGRLDDPSAKR